MGHNDSGSVAIILVNYNGASDTIECIESLERNTYNNYRIIVVDNCSTDDSVSLLKTAQDVHEFVLLCADINNGFSAGNNVGIRYALSNNFDFVLLLNNDTLVEPLFLEIMLSEYQKTGNNSVLTGTILYEKDRDMVWYAGGEINGLTARISHNYMNKSRSILPDKREQISFITGCEILIPTKAIHKVGLMDEDYFLYTEDADYSMRLSSNGYKLYYVPKSIIYHKVSASTSKISKISQYYSVRNRRIFLLKNFHFPKIVIAFAVADLQMLHRIIRKRLSFRTSIAGIIDFYCKRYGKTERQF